MVKKITDAEQIEILEKELAGTQQMLALVLKTIGEPVVVTKETIANGLGNQLIQVDDDIAADAFIFQLAEDDS